MINQVTLTTHEWLQLDSALKYKLIQTFNIPRSSYTQVTDNKVQTDGYTYQDLQAINIASMQNFTGSENANFVELFNLTCDMLTFDLSRGTILVHNIVPTGTIEIRQDQIPQEEPELKINAKEGQRYEQQEQKAPSKPGRKTKK